jgi:hypothetical protein
MQITRAEALCQEFCDSVSVVTKVLENEWGTEQISSEIKCSLEIKFFPELFSRMVREGYCCTQAQRDFRTNKCVAWFEEGEK